MRRTLTSLCAGLAAASAAAAPAASAAALWHGTAPVQALTADGGTAAIALALSGARCGQVLRIDLATGAARRTAKSGVICKGDRAGGVALAGGSVLVDVHVRRHDIGEGFSSEWTRVLLAGPTVAARAIDQDYAGAVDPATHSFGTPVGLGSSFASDFYDETLSLDPGDCDGEPPCIVSSRYLATIGGDGGTLAAVDAAATVLAGDAGRVLTDRGVRDASLAVTATFPSSLEGSTAGDLSGADAAVVDDKGVLHVLDAATGHERRHLALAGKVGAIHVGHGVALWSTPRAVFAVRLADGKQVRILRARTGVRVAGLDAATPGVVVATNGARRTSAVAVIPWARVDALLAA